MLTEARYPGRFFYALPVDVVLSDGTPWPVIRASLAAYGIGSDRIVPMEWDVDYRFKQLFAIASVWSDELIHPEVTQLMRAHLRVPASDDRPRSIAVRRAPGYGRMLENRQEIEEFLRGKGYHCIETGSMDFLDQVAIFSSAQNVFSVLGSDLTNLIYSPEGVNVIAVAPEAFGDNFFYALTLDRKGHFLDLRGKVTRVDQDGEEFNIPLESVKEAVGRLSP